MNLRRLSLLAVAGAAAALSCTGPTGPAGPPGPSGSPGPTGPTPAPSPGVGLLINVQSVSATGGSPVVVYQLTDSAGNPQTMGGVQAFWTLARLGVDSTTGTPAWSTYFTRSVAGLFGTTNQPTYDRNGVYTDLGGGLYRYRFAGTLPQNDDPGATHRLGVWMQVTLPGGSTLSNDATFDYVPSGQAVSSSAGLVTTAACNTCHNPLSAHGGARKKVELCATCHTPQLFDPDTIDPANPANLNPLDFDVLVHRIHTGTSLPSLVAAQQAGISGAKYSVVGYMNRESVFAQTEFDTTSKTVPDIVGVAFPQPLTNCTLCHQGTDKSAWQTRPTRRACQSCHDATWFGTPATMPPRMKVHSGGVPLVTDALCASCHPAVGANEFDPSVKGAHTTPDNSTQLKGLQATIVSASLVPGTNGASIALTYSIKNGDGSVVNPLSSLSGLSAVVGGPTVPDYDFANYYRASLASISTFDAGSGNYSVTLPPRSGTDPYYPKAGPVPPGASGSFAVSLEARRNVTLVGTIGTASIMVEEAAFNPVTYLSVDGSATTPRRLVVDQAKCDACHETLSLHGGQRKNVEQCVICHDPSNSDWVMRPKGTGGNVDLATAVDGIEERSINFKDFLHRLHTGADLAASVPYDVYAYGGSITEWDHVLFPGDRTQCETCHLPGTFTVDAIPAGAAPSVANQTGVDLHLGTAKHQPGEPVVPPVQAACLGCHDTSLAQAHAAANTVGSTVLGNESYQETCILCHGEGQPFSVTAMHGVTP